MIYSKNLFEFFKKNKFIPSKKMGQNFLVDQKIISKILETIQSNYFNDYNLIEIGPGLGSLTYQLRKISNSYKAIEIDKRLYSYLLKNKVITNEELICDDALKLNWDDLFKNDKEFFVVGNLPYSISTRLIDKFINSKKSKTAIIMVQNEMADRLIAKINSKDYNYFSVYVQSKIDVKKLFLIKPNAFIPSPRIDSCIIMLTKRDVDFNFDKTFQTFLKLCFSQRRKTLFNNLKNNYDTTKLITALNQVCDNKIKTRAQELSWKELLKLKVCLDAKNN